jgi:Ca2+-binding EF-hand superfamily protein
MFHLNWKTITGGMLLVLIGLMPMLGCKSRSEKITQKVSEGFKKADTDKDGYLSLSEFETTRVAKHVEDVQAAFNKADTNSDGKLSEAELVTVVEARFNR